MNAPTLHIVIGTAGSGKSTIAQRLARQHGAAYLDKDAMSARFVEAPWWPPAMTLATANPTRSTVNVSCPRVRLAPRRRRRQPPNRPLGGHRCTVQPVPV